MGAFARGDAFYGGRELHGDDHLWIVINDPAAHGGKALIVNITSLKGAFVDMTCVVEKGEHAFVRHRSYVRFNGSRVADATDLDEAERKGLIRRRDSASAALLEKIRLAAKSAPRLKNEYRDFL